VEEHRKRKQELQKIEEQEAAKQKQVPFFKRVQKQEKEKEKSEFLQRKEHL